MAIDDVQWLYLASASCSASRFAGWRRHGPRFSSRAAVTARSRCRWARACVSGGASVAVAARPSERGGRRTVCSASASASRFAGTRPAASPASGGNPFYALEFARALEQSGDPRRHSGVAQRACLRTARGVAGGRSRGTRARRTAQRADHLIVEAVAFDRQPCSNAFAERRPLGSWSWTTTSAFVSAIRCGRAGRVGARSLDGAGCPPPPAELLASSNSACVCTSRWPWDGLFTRLLYELRLLSGCRGLAWRKTGELLPSLPSYFCSCSRLLLTSQRLSPSPPAACC